MKKNMYVIWGTILFLLLSWDVKADNDIYGWILDAQTGETLPGVVVELKSGTGRTVSALDGSFLLRARIALQEVVFVRCMGYKPQEIAVTVGAHGACDLGEVRLETQTIGLSDVVVTSSMAIRRKTPVAMSVTTPETIENKLSNKDYPEILKSVPGIYATRQGGGFGDSRLNLRGFESENVAVMVNGIPMNEMEWGGIYWSNWCGLSDVTRSLQVQRGLGAAQVAAPSVGGSVNILTRSTEAMPGGTISYALGNDGYNKITLDLSSGLRKGWAFTLLGSKSWGDGYVQGTNFESYSYFVNISKQINPDHLISFTAFGAPQEHNRRTDDLLISEWEEQPLKYRYNAAYGFDMNGQRKTTVLNVYHKPQLSLNYYWTINDRSTLSMMFYASFGRGYGYSGQGYTNAWRNKWNATTNDGKVSAEFRAADGTFDFGAIYELNRQSTDGSLMAMGKSINDHNWYGLISTYTHDFSNKLYLLGGIDLRWYKGIHSAKLTDLYGGAYFSNADNRKNVKHSGKDDPDWVNAPLQVGDIVYRDYDGHVRQGGIFGQLEYRGDALTSFVSASLSNSTYWRYDRFYYAPENARSAKSDFTGFTLKGGANYNLDTHHNFFANLGYISRAPFLADGVFLQKETSNAMNKDAVNEKVFSMELGYGYRSPWLTANLNLYRTSWLDKAMATSFYIAGSEERGKINLTGVDALHQGVELDINCRPVAQLLITGMLSIGDWKWDSDASGYIYDSQGQPLTEDKQIAFGIGAPDHAQSTVKLKGVRVGNSAQTTLALGANYRLWNDLLLGLDYTHYTRNYAKFSVRGSDLVIGGDKQYEQPWRMPSAGVTDFNTSYRFVLGKLQATLFANVNNLFNIKYIADATDGAAHDRATAQVFYGFGRNYSVSLKISF